jgi:hypothetical protein
MQAKSAGSSFKRFGEEGAHGNPRAAVGIRERHECKGLRALLASLRQAFEETPAKATLSTNVRGPELSKLAVVVDGAQPPTLLLRGRKKTAAKSKCPCARSESIGRIRFRPMYPDFLHGAPPTPACTAFIKESRMKFANARKLDRKSGVRWGEHGAPVQNLRPQLGGKIRQSAPE